MELTLTSGRKVNAYKGYPANIDSNYDKCLAQMQIANCGFYFVDAQYGDVMDDEFDLSECYELVKKMPL